MHCISEKAISFYKVNSDFKVQHIRKILFSPSDTKSFLHFLKKARFIILLVLACKLAWEGSTLVALCCSTVVQQYFLYRVLYFTYFTGLVHLPV